MSILNSQRLGYQKALTLRTRFTAPNNVRIGYVVVGRPIGWDANDAVPTYYDTEQAQKDTSAFLIGGKKITGNDVQIVIPRKNWTANVVYVPYDDRSNTLFSSANSMYVYTASGAVYKCLDNANNGLSTIEPTGDYLTNSGVIALGDGYIWKYMYKIDPTDKFLNTQWIPVPTEQNTNYFGSGNNVIQGTINRIIVVSGGSGYVQNTTNVIVTGSGVSATATANISNGVIRSVSINNPGVRYTSSNTTVTVTGAGTGANLRPVFPPHYGHAFNPAMELGANSVMFVVKIGEGDATEGGKITSNNDFRQIGLLMEPHKYGVNSAVTIDTANLVVSFVTQLVLTSGSSYTIDEPVYQGSSFANSSFRGYVSDVFTNAVQLVGCAGTAQAGLALVGVNSSVSRTVVSVQNPDLEIGSGDLVYIENFSPIMRSSSQAESIKLVVRF